MSDPSTETLRRGDEWSVAAAAAALHAAGIAARAVPPMGVGWGGEGDWTLQVRPEQAEQARRLLAAMAAASIEEGAEGEPDAEVARTLASAGAIRRLAGALRWLGWSVAVLLMLLGAIAAVATLLDALRGGAAGP